jgi:GNAT superfamily N-acetyltransferase
MLALLDKRSTQVLPSYQRHGLGTWMTRHCNAVADEAGQPTFVLARPKAAKMLETTGFVLGETKIFESSKYGWHEDAEIRVYRRDPGAVGLAG